MKLSGNLRTKYWIIGTSLCVAGVLVSRALALVFAEPSAYILRISGQLLAISGLFVIAYGVSRRINDNTPPTDSK